MPGVSSCSGVGHSWIQADPASRVCVFLTTCRRLTPRGHPGRPFSAAALPMVSWRGASSAHSLENKEERKGTGDCAAAEQVLAARGLQRKSAGSSKHRPSEFSLGQVPRWLVAGMQRSSSLPLTGLQVSPLPLSQQAGFSLIGSFSFWPWGTLWWCHLPRGRVLARSWFPVKEREAWFSSSPNHPAGAGCCFAEISQNHGDGWGGASSPGVSRRMAIAGSLGQLAPAPGAPCGSSIY